MDSQEYPGGPRSSFARPVSGQNFSAAFAAASMPGERFPSLSRDRLEKFRDDAHQLRANFTACNFSALLPVIFGSPSTLTVLVFPCHDPIYGPATMGLELQKDFEGGSTLA
jgi:hypothetical protein